MEQFIYYTLSLEPELAWHFLQDGNYICVPFSSPDFFTRLEWLVADKEVIKIAYRGGQYEKPLAVLLQALRGQSKSHIQETLQAFLGGSGSPTKRLLDLIGQEHPDGYDDYLTWLNHPLLLDIETFDGRIYHNEFERLEVQMQLEPAQTSETYLRHLERLFLSDDFQTVYEEKQYLLNTFAGKFNLPVNATTTDAQLTESFYTKGHLKDASRVFIPKQFMPFTYFLKGSLAKLYQTYQERSPKEAIHRRFGKNGAITQLGDFVISSSAAAPIGFRIPDFDSEKAWGNQVKVQSVEKAVRVDFTHIQATIMRATVADKGFKNRLSQVQKKWHDEPEHRAALDRLLYPIQGAMDTTFDHDLHTPNYAYSMRMTHNLVLVGLLETLVDEGMRPISLNNEVLFLEAEGLEEKRLKHYLNQLNLYYDYRKIENLIIKDTNNYTYYDVRDQVYVFRGGSFNHHEGTDLKTNMDKPAIVDWVLQEMIKERHDFVEAHVLDYLNRFLAEASLEKIKEYFMVPIYPIKNRYGVLYKKNQGELVHQARACFATNTQSGYWYSQLHPPKTGQSDLQAKDLIKQYHLPISGAVKLVKQATLRLDDLKNLTVASINKDYYAQLILNEMLLWRN